MTDTASLVLVHGGFLGPWLGADVQQLLTERGIRSVAPDLPSMQESPGDLYDDVTAVQSVVAEAGPVILCRHSYGGLVITEAAGSELDVRHLVYLAAAVPDSGQSMHSLAASLALPHDDGGEDITVLPDGRIQLRPQAAHQSLFHDCCSARADTAIEQLRPMNRWQVSKP